MKILLHITSAVGAVVLLFLICTGWHEIRHFLFAGEPQQITSEVQLINQCHLADSSFALRNTDTGRSVQFSNGRAQIDGAQGTYLQIVLASRFDDVTFSGEKQPIKPQMTMTADCNSGERMRGVMDGIGDKFGN
jgi:hypothetical protein